MAVIYHGKRVQGKAIVTYQRTEMNRKLGEKPLRHVDYHSDDFEWGYPGSGPADLALSILAHHLGETWVNGKYLRKMRITQETPLCWKLHQDFKRDVIAILDRTEWELTNKQVHDWLMSQVPKETTVQHPPALNKEPR